MRDLKEIREEINEIDEKLIELFKRRMECAKDVGNYKRQTTFLFLTKTERMKFLMMYLFVVENTDMQHSYCLATLWNFPEHYNTILLAQVKK